METLDDLNMPSTVDELLEFVRSPPHDADLPSWLERAARVAAATGECATCGTMIVRAEELAHALVAWYETERHQRPHEYASAELRDSILSSGVETGGPTRPHLCCYHEDQEDKDERCLLLGTDGGGRLGCATLVIVLAVAAGCQKRQNASEDGPSSGPDPCVTYLERSMDCQTAAGAGDLLPPGVADMVRDDWRSNISGLCASIMADPSTAQMFRATARCASEQTCAGWLACNGGGQLGPAMSGGVGACERLCGALTECARNARTRQDPSLTEPALGKELSDAYDWCVQDCTAKPTSIQQAAASCVDHPDGLCQRLAECVQTSGYSAR